MIAKAVSPISQLSLSRRQEILPGNNNLAGLLLKIPARLADNTAAFLPRNLVLLVHSPSVPTSPFASFPSRSRNGEVLLIRFVRGITFGTYIE
jgi:hypothetical protein